MNIYKKYIADLFFPLRFYLLVGTNALLFIFSFFVPGLLPLAKILLGFSSALVLVDYIFLFFLGRRPTAQRLTGERLSNGDDNLVKIRVRNRMNFSVSMEVIDELPEQFQLRNFKMTKQFPPGDQQTMTYSVKPVERGLYSFGDIIIYLQSRLGLVSRRTIADAAQELPVYPSIMQMGKYQLLAHAAMVNESGNRRMRKIGHSMEFEQIKDYITGDDIRNINWKATARKGQLMINNYTDEKSQQVYCIIDKGRLMKMPFGGLSLLDYAINSTVVLSNICLQKQDRIGLITFANKIGSIIPADRKPIQRDNILQVLYKQQTGFLESDYEMLYTQVRNKIKQRSLLILFSNFESVNGLHRQLVYLRSIARHHLLLVVFFENTELTRMANENVVTKEEIYTKTIADKFVYEKKLIVKELMKYGILSILTSPENLTVSTINKYLELKNRQAI